MQKKESGKKHGEKL